MAGRATTIGISCADAHGNVLLAGGGGDFNLRAVASGPGPMSTRLVQGAGGALQVSHAWTERIFSVAFRVFFFRQTYIRGCANVGWLGFKECLEPLHWSTTMIVGILPYSSTMKHGPGVLLWAGGVPGDQGRNVQRGYHVCTLRRTTPGNARAGLARSTSSLPLEQRIPMREGLGLP